MSRRVLWIPIFIVAAVVGAAVFIAAVFGIVGIVDSGREHKPNPTQPHPDAFTPEEVSVAASAQKDGTLAVTATLVFDTPKGSDDPLYWYLGAARIGWESSERHAQYVVLPTATEVTGVVLTDDGAGEALTVEKDDSKVDDPLRDDVVYRFVPKNEWTEGRHAVEISYVLEGVHVEVGGTDLMVLPLQFVSGPNRAVNYRRADVGEGNTIQCMSNNITFKLDDTCAALEGASEDAESTVSWADDGTGSVDAIAFATPDVVTVDPEPVTRREK